MSRFTSVTVTIAVKFGKSGSLNDRERQQGVGLGTSKERRLTGTTAVAFLVIRIAVLLLGWGLL